MANTFSPLGISVNVSSANVVQANRQLVDGTSSTPRKDAFKRLSLLATWFSKPGFEHCALAFLEKSMDYIDSNMDVLDKHFALADHCKVFYRWRAVVPGSLENAIASCERSIAMHQQAAVEAKKVFGSVPAHACFRQLRIIEEGRGNFDRAIELCEMAKAGGWADDWDHAIARIEKKKAKAALK